MNIEKYIASIPKPRGRRSVLEPHLQAIYYLLNREVSHHLIAEWLLSEGVTTSRQNISKWLQRKSRKHLANETDVKTPGVQSVSTAVTPHQAMDTSFSVKDIGAKRLILSPAPRPMGFVGNDIRETVSSDVGAMAIAALTAAADTVEQRGKRDVDSY